MTICKGDHVVLTGVTTQLGNLPERKWHSLRPEYYRQRVGSVHSIEDTFLRSYAVVDFGERMLLTVPVELLTHKRRAA